MTRIRFSLVTDRGKHDGLSRYLTQNHGAIPICYHGLADQSLGASCTCMGSSIFPVLLWHAGDCNLVAETRPIAHGPKGQKPNWAFLARLNRDNRNGPWLCWVGHSALASSGGHQLYSAAAHCDLRCNVLGRASAGLSLNGGKHWPGWRGYRIVPPPEGI